MAALGTSTLSFYAQAPPDLHAEALRLLLGERGVEARAVLAGLASVESLQANPADSLAVFERQGHVVAAMLHRLQPGKTALVWPPRIAAGEAAETAAVLVKAVMSNLRNLDIRLVQAFPDAGAPHDERVLLAAGFEHIADLLYLVWLSDAGTIFPADEPRLGGHKPDLQFVPYDASLHGRLARVVEQTYEGTRDCPQLNGVRATEDVLAGYRATGTFEPTRWLIAQRGGQDVGCVLLASHPESGQWELVYLGIVPAARRTGLGGQLVRQAQGLCQREQGRQLVLAVDADNEPALKLYASAGFVAWDRRPVYLRIFTGESVP